MEPLAEVADRSVLAVEHREFAVRDADASDPQERSQPVYRGEVFAGLFDDALAGRPREVVWSALDVLASDALH
jgi:hypothetical protein